MKKIYLDWLLEAGWKRKCVQHGIAEFYIPLPDRHLVTYAHFSDCSDEFVYHDEASLGTCLDPYHHSLSGFGKLYLARQVLNSLLTGKEIVL